MQIHKGEVHNVEKEAIAQTFNCDECDFLAVNKSNLRSHMDKKHCNVITLHNGNECNEVDLNGYVEDGNDFVSSKDHSGQSEYYVDPDESRSSNKTDEYVEPDESKSAFKILKGCTFCLTIPNPTPNPPIILLTPSFSLKKTNYIQI